MKYTLKIDDQTFSVEVNDLRARPIVAVIDGECFEVWPEGNGGGSQQPVQAAAPAAAPAAPAPAVKITPAPVSTTLAGSMVKAPIPGVIVAIHVKPGDEVKHGQELITIEAMKMKNAIRATRAGRIAEVFVSAGETVNHSAPLVSFAE